MFSSFYTITFMFVRGWLFIDIEQSHNNFNIYAHVWFISLSLCYRKTGPWKLLKKTLLNNIFPLMWFSFLIFLIHSKYHTVIGNIWYNLVVSICSSTYLYAQQLSGMMQITILWNPLNVLEHYFRWMENLGCIINLT